MYIHKVAQAGNKVCVDLLGGPQNACGAVTFTFEDDKVRALALACFRAWCKTETAVELDQSDPDRVRIVRAVPG